MITIHQSKSSNSVLGLVFEVAGMTLTVKAGTFTLMSEACDLLEDQTYTLPTNANGRGVFIALVKDKTTGAISVMVDDCIDDGVDVMWEPAPSDTYSRIHLLAKGHVSAAAVDADADGWWEVWHLVALAAQSSEAERGTT